MTSGFLELIAVLTTLGGLGVSANPNAPSGAEILEYAPRDADFTAHVDVQAVVPRNYKLLQSLRGHEALRKHPHAREMADRALGELEAGRTKVSQQFGIDLVEDLHSITLWMKLPGAGDPDVLVVARGNIPDKIVDAIGRMEGGTPTTVHGARVLRSPDGVFMLAVRNRELFFGSATWVEPRLDSSWKPARRKSGSAGADIEKQLDGKPFAFLSSTPSAQAVARIAQEIPGDNVAKDLLTGHEFASIAIASRGLSWKFKTREKSGYERAVMASEGILDVFRASHIGTRGMARVIMAALHSYRGQSKEIDMILDNERALLDLVPRFTGDGSFKVAFKNNPRTRTVSVEATGKKLSDVVPIAGLLPLISAGVFLAVRDTSEHEAMAEAAAAHAVAEARPQVKDGGEGARVDAVAPAQAPVTGVDVRSVYRAVKRARGM